MLRPYDDHGVPLLKSMHWDSPAPPIYLDHAATTPVDSEVLAAMLPYFSEIFGNASSTYHQFGQRAWWAENRARQQVAALLGCQPEEIIFTSGGTESINLALRGLALAARGRHLITSAVEHPAVRNTMTQLRDHFGFSLTLLPVDSNGLVAPSDLESALQPDTALVSIIYASNEIGTIQPIAELGAICRARGIPFHTDAMQAVSQIRLDIDSVDALSFGAHKIYGPKGVGCLYLRRGWDPLSMQTGGAQEQGRRAGTTNVPLIVGLAAALAQTTARMESDVAHYRTLQQALRARIAADIPAARLTGHPTLRLHNHVSIVIPGQEANDLLMRLDMAGVAASSGSACSTGNPEPSPILLALGLDSATAKSGLRFTVGRATTLPMVQEAVTRLREVIA